MSEIELADRILRDSLQILRATAGEQAVVDEILRNLANELRQLLQSRPLSEASKREITALIKQADEIIAPAYRTAAASVDTRALAVIVAEKTVDLIGDTFALDLTAPTVETLASLTKDVLIDGSPASAWWEKQADDTAFKFAAQVRQGVVNGETNERIVQRIVGRQGEPGIMDVARRLARALVGSSVMTAANDARLAVYRKNAKHIRGVRWLATLDGHTCARCAALDGLHWNLDGDPIDGNRIAWNGGPPIHFNDRCVLTPLAKKIGFGLDERFDAISQRASSQGPIKNTTFQGFFDRMTKAQQDEQFGPVRAQLMRDGKITVRDLISGTGRELTIDQLKAI
jgi:hypothetical protein